MICIHSCVQSRIKHNEHAGKYDHLDDHLDDHSKGHSDDHSKGHSDDHSEGQSGPGFVEAKGAFSKASWSCATSTTKESRRRATTVYS